MRATLAFVVCGLCASSGDDHGHAGDGEFEWAGIFEVPDSLYMWTAQKVDGQYGHGDTTMKMAVLPANASTKAELERLEPLGEHALEENCTEVDVDGVITPQMDVCYSLHFDVALWQSIYRVDTSSASSVVFFTQHVPTEFENTAHYLKDSTGEDIEPQAEHPEAAEEAHEDDHVEWGASIGAAIIVNLATLIGVIFSVPVFAKLAEANAAVFEGVQCMFAAGALIACAVFLLLFEATHLIGEGWTSEVEILWRWGTMILVGFFFPLVFDGITALATESGEGQNDQLAEGGAPRSRVRIMSAVTIGDFLHNLCDGFFIGAAFKGCGISFGWGVALATVLHELPQELADYGILTGKSVGMRPWRALLLNFIAGLSVIIGVLIINAADVENSAVGLLLSFGGGVYLYVAAVECMPRVHQLKLSPKINALCTVCFIIGAVLIGLILLDHEHCVPEGGEEGGHGHHGHGH